MANKRSAASSRGRDLFRTEVSSLLADLGELAGERGPRPVPSAPPLHAAEPAAGSIGPVAHGSDAVAGAVAAEAPSPVGAAGETPAPPESIAEVTPAAASDAPEPAPSTPPEAEAPADGHGASEVEELISFSPSYLPPLPPVLSPLTAAPEPAAPSRQGFSAPELAPPPGPWAAAPEPEVAPEPWPSPPEPPAPPEDWVSTPEPAAAPGGWASPPEPPAAPGDWVSPPEPAATPGLWPFMSNLSTAAGGWDSWPEPVAAPDPRTSPHESADASEQWVSPPAYATPAPGQGWPRPPGEAGTAPAPGSARIEPPGPPPPMVWPSTVVAARAGGVPGPAGPPASHHPPAALPPMWPAPAEPPRVEGGDDLVGMAAPPAPPPAPETETPARDDAEIADTKLPTGGITASELAAQDQSAPPWRRAPSSQPSGFPALSELPGWRLDGPARRPMSTPGLAAGTERDRAQRFRSAPPSDPAATDEREASTVDQAPPPPEAPGVASEAADRLGPGPEGGDERTPQRPPTPIPPDTATASGPGAAARPGLPLLPGGQPAQVSTRPWTLASAMQPLAPMAPPAIRAAGVPLPEPSGPVVSRSRSTGINLPFAAVVTALVVVLVGIIVLIVLDIHH